MSLKLYLFNRYKFQQHFYLFGEYLPECQYLVSVSGIFLFGDYYLLLLLYSHCLLLFILSLYFSHLLLIHYPLAYLLHLLSQILLSDIVQYLHRMKLRKHCI